MKNTEKKYLRDSFLILAAVILLMLFTREFIVQPFKIPSGSMETILSTGDYILVNKFIYGIYIPFTDIRMIPGANIKRFDVIVFKFPKDPSKDYIKRCIGLPGDIVEIKDKVIYIDNQKIEDIYGVHIDKNIEPKAITGRDNFGPFTVPEGKYFVMGDNRENSFDSREWGYVPGNYIKGRAFLIFKPLKRAGIIR